MSSPAWNKKNVDIPEDIAHNLKLGFEISLFESVVKHDPEHIDALFSLGDSYTKSGLYEEGLAVDKRLAELLPDNAVVHYNLACSYSLLKERDLAFETLEESLSLGYNEFEFMDEDTDLDNIRQDPRYDMLIDKFRQHTA